MPAAPPKAPPVLPREDGFPSGAARRVRSVALDFPIELSLPGRQSWQVVDGPNWLVAEHSNSSSLLAVRTWRAERLVRRSDCESQARLARPSIPILHEESVVDRRPFAAPQGFDSELVVSVEPSARGILGYATVIGASVGRCYAAVFTTAVSGAEAEQEVAARLQLFVDHVLSGVRLRSVDDRAVRRRLVSTPPGASE